MTQPTIIIAFVIIFLTASFSLFLGKLLKYELKPVKYETIDGLRGYLAFFVFIHHSCIYYYFLPTWNWKLPPLKLYIHFGQTSVALFFMITGFLFFSKLLEAKEKKIDWTHFFVSRFLRLYPLYLILLSVMLIIIYIMSDFKRADNFVDLFFEIKDWILFTVFESPNINGYKETAGITAGILWSLKYEWMFYFLLPILGILFFKQRPKLFLLLICVYVLYKLYNPYTVLLFHFLPFFSGFLAAILIRHKKTKEILLHPLNSLVAIVSLTCVVCFFETAYTIFPLLLTTIAFVIIACGNSLFGLLTLKASKYLGQISYSIYLLHTTILFIVFRMVLGMDVASKLSLYEFWFLILGIGFLLIFICYFTYYKIELPCMNASIFISNKIKNCQTKINALYFNIKK